MSATTKVYRLRIYDREDTTVDYTYTSALAGAVSAGGQTVRALDCMVESRPWTVEVVDASEAFTATLADTAGRAHLLLRLADISVSIDGGAYTVIATGRIAGIELVGLAAFRLRLSDERVVERQTKIFTSADTTCVYPPGIMDGTWGPIEFVSYAPGHYTDSAVEYGARVRTAPVTSVELIVATGPDEIAPSLMSAIESDIRPGVPILTATSQVERGSFETLRATIPQPAGADLEYEVVSFYKQRGDYKFKTGGANAYLDEKGLHWISLYDPDNTVPAVGHGVGLSFPGQAPTRDIPLHIDDIHPMQLLKDIWDGEYQAADTPVTVRYDSTALAALIADPRFGTVRFRIESPATMATWLLENIYRPFRILPLVGADGRLVPTYVGTATYAETGNPASLFEFTGANSQAPTWRHATDEQVTVLTTEYPHDREFRSNALITGAESALDRIHVETHELTVEHDLVATGYQRREIRVRIDGVRSQETWTGTSVTGAPPAFTDQLASDVFSRFGDGPIYFQIHGLSATSTVVPGDYVRISHDTFPNLSTGARGGTRIGQILSRTVMPDGYLFEGMEIGEYSAVLTAPTVTATQHGTHPEHMARITVSGFPSAGGWELWAARTTTAAEPGVNDSRWRYVQSGTETAFDLTDLRSDSRYWFRARSVQANKISSDWSTAVTMVTTAYSAPTGLATSEVFARSALLTWTLTHDYLSVEVLIDGARFALLRPGAARCRLLGLEASTSYTIGVRYVDPYGGVSATSATNLTTTATQETMNPPVYLAIAVGENVGTRSTA